MSVISKQAKEVDVSYFHGKRNKGKKLAYWVGFLEGALASGRIENLEQDVLEAEAKSFASFFEDPDAFDLAEDLGAACFSDESDLIEQLQTIIEDKRQDLVDGELIDREAAEISSFLGFCAGVICDGVVSEQEVVAIYDRFRRSGTLRFNAVFRGFYKAIQSVMADGVVTPEEALEVQEWLARLVGDGYKDTGISNIGNVTTIADMVRDPSDVEIEGQHIVLTGPMRMGTRKFIQEQIARAGGINEKSITSRTTMIVVSETASPVWFASHFGRKIEAAHELMEKGYSIAFVAESALEGSLSRALSSQAPVPIHIEESVNMSLPPRSIVALVPGQNMAIESVATNLFVRWEGPNGVDGLDPIVFVLGQDKKVFSGESMVFFNQPSWNDVVSLAGQGCGVHLDLHRLDDAVERIVLAVVPQSVMDQPFSAFSSVQIDVQQQGVPTASFFMTNGGEETAMILMEVYRRNGVWKVRAVGEGFASGLLGLAHLYGVDVDDDQEPADMVQVADVSDSDTLCVAEDEPESRAQDVSDVDVLEEPSQREGIEHGRMQAIEDEPILLFAPSFPLSSQEIDDEETEDAVGPSVFPVQFRRALNVMADRPQDVLEDATTTVWAEEMQGRIIEALRDFAMDPRPADPPFRVIPNGVLINFRGHADLTLPKVYKRETEFYTTYGINVVDIRPGPGYISFFVEREKRARISMAQAWLSANWASENPGVCTNLFIGVREDNAKALFLNLDGEHEGYEEHAPHTLIAGETKSGKGVLTQSLLLQLIALNSPKEAQITIVDPKKGVDYTWIADAPHLTGPIITTKEESGNALKKLVLEMERRYALLQKAGSPNTSHYNRLVPPEHRLPRLYFVHDEIGGWMAEAKSKAYGEIVSSAAARLGMEGRAAGIHLILITQRPDVQAVPGNLRDQMGNRLCLRVQRSDGSKMILNAQGGERLLGRGHIAVALPGERPPGNAAFFVGQVPFAEPEDFAVLGRLATSYWNRQG